MRMLGAAIVGTVLASALVGCGSKPSKLPGTAPYSWRHLPGAAPRTTKPVTAELYIYDRGRFKSGDPEAYKYTYVGTPWRFRFPGTDYHLMTDVGGGPQGHVFMETDLQPILPLVPIVTVEPPAYPGGEVRRWVSKNIAEFKMYPISKKFATGAEPSVLQSKEAFLTQLDRSIESQTSRYRNEPHGMACGVDWYREIENYLYKVPPSYDPTLEAHVKNRKFMEDPNRVIRHPELAFAEFAKTGFRPKNLPSDPFKVLKYSITGYTFDPKYGGIGLWCSAGGSCGAQFQLPYAQKFPITVSFDPRHICNYRKIIVHIDGIMRKHTITYPDVNKAYNND
jgi:hypothetical protein